MSTAAGGALNPRANANAKPVDVTKLRKYLDLRLPGRGFHAMRRYEHVLAIRNSSRFNIGLAIVPVGITPMEKLSEDVRMRHSLKR